MIRGVSSPYINHFLQPDSLISNPSNPQAWNRYSYALNNPIRYSDPSGHSVDCGLGDAFCNGGKYKPGGLISLYKHYYGKDKLAAPYNSLKPDRDRLSKEIENYLVENPDYKFKNDNLIRSSANYGMFYDIRHEYWRNRCMHHNGCDAIADPSRLFRYYDLHENFQISKFDPSRVNWANVTLDGAGIPLAIFGASEVTSALKASMSGASAMSFIASSGQAIASARKGDFTGALTTEGLTLAGAVPGSVGFTANSISLVRDVNAGFYSFNYVPPIPR